MSEELVVVARNQAEMQQAQEKLVAWADRKMEEARRQFLDADENVNIATKNKWKVSGLKRMRKIAQERYEYYEKMKAALEAGYVIIPNMEMDVFAIRTTKKGPSGNIVTGRRRDQHDGSDFVQDTDRPALGEGKNVSDVPVVAKEAVRGPDQDGKEVTLIDTWADEFGEIDFPFKWAKPQVLDATAKAVAMKCFDRLGVVPGRQARKQDPMVIGQIVFRGSGGRWQEKTVSFLVTWWLRERDLEV